MEVGTGGRGSQYINRNYPAVEGTTAGTTDQSKLKEHLDADTIKLEKEFGSL